MKHILFYHDYNILIHVHVGIIYHGHSTCLTLIHVHVEIIHHDHSTCFTLIQCKMSVFGTAVVDSRSCFNRTPTEHTTRVFKSRSQYSAIRIITGLLIKIRNSIQTFATF